MYSLMRNGEFYLGPFHTEENVLAAKASLGKIYSQEFEVIPDYAPSWEPVSMTKEEMRAVSSFILTVPPGEMGTWGHSGPLKYIEGFAEAASYFLNQRPEELWNGCCATFLAHHRKDLTEDGLKRASRDLENQYFKLTGSRLFNVDEKNNPEKVMEVFDEAS